MTDDSASAEHPGRSVPAHPSTKILDRQVLLERHGRPRSDILVFTNGCFDLLHPGHVELLHAARSLGGLLVVGLNSDASVARLKGPSRPLVPDHARAFLLAGLASVDVVTTFSEDTPLELIRALSPDILVKGGDYDPTAVVGRAEVLAAGGRVEIIPFVQGYSTTSFLDRLRAHQPVSSRERAADEPIGSESSPAGRESF